MTVVTFVYNPNTPDEQRSTATFNSETEAEEHIHFVRAHGNLNIIREWLGTTEEITEGNRVDHTTSRSDDVKMPLYIVAVAEQENTFTSQEAAEAYIEGLPENVLEAVHLNYDPDSDSNPDNEGWPDKYWELTEDPINTEDANQ